MANLREMLNPVEHETVIIKCVPIPFPVEFMLPLEVTDKLPRSVVKSIEGVRILRFYTAPMKGDLIEFKGHLWIVIGRYHECQVKGSKNPDHLPLTLTEYHGEVG